ncbi:MAG: tRNA (N(6)-L-threonylcarbamoyladenosine(37)-C(2))-methylthiotransferase MtaB [candidate division Zixibacteria bacterium]|nr:tRNA (N(6)-L-threonylcarbamoyladenosine(37)-C(2))-methylthiotransferase MtaB [candidate division Zixibacteria bacterium]
MPKASLHTLGCRLNQAETAIIANSLAARGYEIVEFGETAEVTVINTCTVTEQADAKCRQAVRQALRVNPAAFVAVVGCYAQHSVSAIAAIPGVDLVIGNEHKLRVGEFLGTLQKRPAAEIVHSLRLPETEFTIETAGLYSFNTRANLKIQDGCNHFCSFCIIPTVRGRARSRQFEDIMREARSLAAAGHRELVLTGVNIGTYKNDGKTLLKIIEGLETVDGVERIRISSIEPTTIGMELVRYMATSPKLCRYLHIPIQSGDDRILRAMRRKHTIAPFAKFIEWTVKQVPEIGLGTDVMVGFPGETDQEFANTREMLTELPFAYFHVFTYSDRPGTPSYALKPKVPHQVKKERTRNLIELSARKRRAFGAAYLGRTAEVLFETIEGERWAGYTDNYLRVHVDSETPLENQVLPIRLTALSRDGLIGEVATGSKATVA